MMKYSIRLKDKLNWSWRLSLRVGSFPVWLAGGCEANRGSRLDLPFVCAWASLARLFCDVCNLASNGASRATAGNSSYCKFDGLLCSSAYSSCIGESILDGRSRNLLLVWRASSRWSEMELCRERDCWGSACFARNGRSRGLPRLKL